MTDVKITLLGMALDSFTSLVTPHHAFRQKTLVGTDEINNTRTWYRVKCWKDSLGEVIPEEVSTFDWGFERLVGFLLMSFRSEASNGTAQ